MDSGVTASCPANDAEHGLQPVLMPRHREGIACPCQPRSMPGVTVTIRYAGVSTLPNAIPLGIMSLGLRL